ncbi:MAG: regulator of cell autolysis, partial [Bacteroidota bacterium]|nr:regulator of cell autolysis [Bacteroidota bacterium]
MLVLVCLIGSGISAFSQEKEQDETSKLKQKSGSVKKSLERGEHDLSIAAGYEDLVKELVKNNDLVKAEEYQQKAVDLYKKNKSKEQLANALRSLAKIQEAQNKTSDAIQSYDKASQNSNFELNNSINTSDVVRLKNSNNPVEQTNSINKKLNILKKGSNSNSSVVKEDIKDAYKQLAEVNV